MQDDSNCRRRGWRALKNTTRLAERVTNRGGILAIDFDGFKASILSTCTYVDFTVVYPEIRELL